VGAASPGFLFPLCLSCASIRREVFCFREMKIRLSIHPGLLGPALVFIPGTQELRGGRRSKGASGWEEALGTAGSSSGCRDGRMSAGCQGKGWW
jgi:hypothetical protein